MADHISIDVEGDDRIIVKLEEVEHSRRRVQGVLEGMGNYAVYWLRLYAPMYAGYTLRHIDHTSARWRPGGAGGAGEWEVTAGVKRGTSKHPLYVNQGTGIYAGQSLIRPVRSRVMTFQKRGELRRFKRYTRGQKAQPFLYMAFQQVRLYASGRVGMLGRELFN